MDGAKLLLYVGDVIALAFSSAKLSAVGGGDHIVLFVCYFCLSARAGCSYDVLWYIRIVVCHIDIRLVCFRPISVQCRGVIFFFQKTAHFVQ